MTIANIYARFSDRPDAEESQSNEKQIERCREFAAEQGYTVGQIFHDDGATGMDDERDPNPEACVMQRPGLVQAIQATKRGMVLLCRWRSRISREGYIQEYVERVLNTGGAVVEAADEDNSTGVSGRIVRGIKRELARDEVERTRLMTKLAMHRHQYQAGRRMTRIDRIPFGFRIHPDNPALIVPDPDEQEIVQIAKRLAGKGMSAYDICNFLDAQGRARRGKTWRNGHRIIERILNSVK
jgi:DNA invertase Pin-like site-specific DNA recombinase